MKKSGFLWRGHGKAVYGIVLFVLAACTGDLAGLEPPLSAHIIRGSVAGLLDGNRLVLRESRGNTVSVSSNGSFAFLGPLPSGATYEVTVATQPAGQTCVVTHGSGTLSGADAVIEVTCPHFVYVANATSNNISAYSIDAVSGALTPVAGSPFATGPGPNPLTFDPSGRFAFVANVWGNSISSFVVDGATGRLSPVEGSPFTACGGPASVTVHPGGQFIYAVNTSFAGSVCAFRIDAATGAITQISGSPFEAGGYPGPLTIDPSGRFAFSTSAGGCNCIYAYRIDPTTGALTVAGTTSLGAPSVSIVVTPSGKFAYVGNYGSNNILGYAVDGVSGALSAVAGSPFDSGAPPSGNSPSKVTVSANGKFAYIANSGGAGSVSAYAIDEAGGVLTPLSGSPYAAPLFANYIVIEPLGRFAYVGGGTVAAYKIDALTGALVGTGESMAADGALKVDPLGRFAYSTNEGANNVSGFSIDPATGNLRLIEGSPFAAGTAPRFITTR